MTRIARSSIGMVLLAAACANPPTSGGSSPQPSGQPAPAPSSPSSAAPASGKTPYAVLQTTKGRIVARLFPTDAPKTVENFVGLATGRKAWTDPRTGQPSNKALYNGTTFHRVIPGFMIQGGDPLGTGTGGPGYRFEDEFSNRTFDKAGLLAMANAGPNTNGSQFFITLAPTPWLNNKHTIFGEVVEGQGVVEAIGAAPRSNDGMDRPLEPQVIQSVTIEYR